MKVAVILLSILFCTPAMTSNNLLHCLAKEEESFHKNKKYQFEYQLNQEIISQFLQMKKITVKQRFIDEICQSKYITFKTVYLLLLHQKDFFINPESLSKSKIEFEIIKGQIKEILKNSHDILVQLLTSVQIMSKDINCLDRIIPLWQDYKIFIQHTQEESSDQHDIRLQKMVRKIIKSIGDNPARLYQCL